MGVKRRSVPPHHLHNITHETFTSLCGLEDHASLPLAENGSAQNSRRCSIGTWWERECCQDGEVAGEVTGSIDPGTPQPTQTRARASAAGSLKIVTQRVNAGNTDESAASAV